MIGKALLPQPGVVDQLGNAAKPWQNIVGVVVKDAAGNLYLKQGMDASAIGTGVLNAARINNLLGTTTVDGNLSNTLATIIAAATTGASDPAARINAGLTLLNGSKIAPDTLSWAALATTANALANLLTIASGTAGFVSDDYNGTNVGFKITEAEFKVLMSAAVWAGILTGTIAIGNLTADAVNGIAMEDPNVANSGWHTDITGRSWWGADAYADAIMQIDQYGNFYLNDTPTALSRVDLGALDLTSIKGVQFSQQGGQFSGNLTLTPLTRGALVYYTTDGTDPTTSNTRTLYNPLTPIPINPVSSITVKAVCYKIVYGTVTSFVFTASANTVAAPTFNPLPGFYTTPNATFSVSLASGTPGATIKYTLDGTIPSPSNGIVYTGPIAVPRGGTTPINAYATKAGLTDSAQVSGSFTIKKGTGAGGGGGNQ
jgi:hypothetical protein